MAFCGRADLKDHAGVLWMLAFPCLYHSSMYLEIRNLINDRDEIEQSCSHMMTR